MTASIQAVLGLRVRRERPFVVVVPLERVQALSCLRVFVCAICRRCQLLHSKRRKKVTLQLMRGAVGGIYGQIWGLYLIGPVGPFCMHISGELRWG